MLSPRIEIPNEHRKRVSEANLNRRVQICCYSPEELSRTSVVDPELVTRSLNMLIQHVLCSVRTIPSQVSGIKAEFE
mgnify:CR=1